MKLPKCPVCKTRATWNRILKSQGYEADGWQLELISDCDECSYLNDQFSFIYDTKQQCIDNWPK